ncbi:MAG: hypothetical protein J0M36_01005 [Caulobacterales bacterium]|nr:hypothetical protein [Caulobacterales bacterium]
MGLNDDEREDDRPEPPAQGRPGLPRAAVLPLVSTLVAVLVGMTSIFTSLQAMNLTQATAQQMVFENQLQACLALNAVSARINQNFGVIDAALKAPVGSVTAATLREAMEVNDERYAELNQEYLKLKMLMPFREIDEAALKALDTGLEANHAAWAVVEGGAAVTPAQHSAIMALADRQADELLVAGDLCGRHVSDIVRGKARLH